MAAVAAAIAAPETATPRRPWRAARAPSGMPVSPAHGINARATVTSRPFAGVIHGDVAIPASPAAASHANLLAHHQPRRSIAHRSSTSSPRTSQAASCIAIVGSTCAGTTRTRSPTFTP